jgi:hypothetical protein
MAIKTIYNEDRGIIIEASGVFTNNDLIELHKEAYQNDEQIKEIPYMILDVTNIERNEVSNNQVISNARIDDRALSINPKMRLAIWARADLEFGLGRMWEIYACEIPGHKGRCNVFRDRDELIKWIKSEA